ncbi:MAG TPA: small ribosomal subunit Rsm22 family protein [Polyangiaceae bacterium]
MLDSELRRPGFAGSVDDGWLDVIDAVARESGLALAPSKLAVEVRALSEAYNTGDFAKSRARGALSARLLFSFARDVPKMECAARELADAELLKLPMRVLDVGAGLGASTWGLARLLAKRGLRGTIDVAMVDEDEAALQIARAIVRAHPTEGDVEVRVVPETRGPYDVILVGQSLGEIDPDETKQVAFLSKLLERLTPDGSLVVVEPALRDRTRRLHRVRDALASRGITIFAPCLHSGACPMLARESDWCHEDVAIDLPPRVATIARAAGLRWQGLTFSYLVLRRDEKTLRSSIASPVAFRVVSAPIDTKGKRELFLCGATSDGGGEIRRVARLDRDEKPKSAWSDAARGDVLVLSRPLGVGEKRITHDVGVKKANPRGTS